MLQFQTTLSRSLVAAGLAASLASAGCASAAPRDDGGGDRTSEFARSGVYAGLYGIRAFEDFDTSGNHVHAGDSDSGVGLKLGYRVSPEVAVEALAEDVKGFRLSGGSANADLDLMNFGVAGKYFFMTEQIQPYVVAGVGVARSDVSHYSYDHDGGFVRAGLGADFYFTPNVALFGEANYNLGVGGVSDLDHVDLQLGILFRF